MASADENVERIKFEAKKELLRSIKGLQSSIEKSCDNVLCCTNQYRDEYGDVASCYNRFKCKEKITVHNIDIPAVAKLMAQLPIFCKFEENGCQEILMKEDMIEHEQCCVYRPINCAHLKCTQKPTYSGFMDHLAEFHKEFYNFEFMEDKRFIIRTGDLEPGLFSLKKRISVFNFTFFGVGIIKDQFMFSWIYILGGPEVAKNFFYHVKVKKENTKDELTFCGQVRSLSEHYEEITKSFNAFFMPIVKMKEFLDGDSKLSLEYQIRNMKDEAKDDNEESGISDDDE